MCEGNSYYSFRSILLKRNVCYNHGLKICMCFLLSATFFFFIFFFSTCLTFTFFVLQYYESVKGEGTL